MVLHRPRDGNLLELLDDKALWVRDGRLVLALDDMVLDGMLALGDMLVLGDMELACDKLELVCDMALVDVRHLRIYNNKYESPL